MAVRLLAIVSNYLVIALHDLNCWPSDGQKPTRRQRLLLPNSITDPDPNPASIPDPGNICRTDQTHKSELALACCFSNHPLSSEREQYVN